MVFYSISTSYHEFAGDAGGYGKESYLGYGNNEGNPLQSVMNMLKDLYKLCLAYYVVIGEKDETFKKVGSQNQQKFGEVRKLPKARKTGACIEMRIRENIYSCIRNRIIRFETKMNDQSGNSTN